ncbi:hypothetical protein [Pandoraea communis]|uniref:hypothetical protein n=1 Tax=Pandoraea communis TaxID=2508297 RepID=UPI0025A67AD1|nr:hypothetical protein [Pandoraea communis]MDM8357486.1 hypothetical protein [Pandoraea communis]
MQNTRPPLGLVPKAIHDERRARQILGAMQRYSDAGLPVPREWMDEFTELLSKIWPPE